MFDFRYILKNLHSFLNVRRPVIDYKLLGCEVRTELFGWRQDRIYL